MNKKILIISPTPTHPANAGNRVRILNMAGFLMSQGHEVYFLFSRQEEADETAMRSFWGNNMWAIDNIPEGRSFIYRYLKQITSLFSDQVKYCSTIDEHYNTLLDEAIIKIKNQVEIDAVIVEYIFQSKALLHFDDKVLKLIDSHDVMTGRHKQFQKEGKEPSWYSTSFGQEKKGIRRADVVIAIQEKEKLHFSRMTDKPVITVGHLVTVNHQIRPDPRKALLFVGSDNPSNYYGILDFLSKDFPMIKAAFPALELFIAGNVCNRLENIPEGVNLLGEQDDLSEAYSLSDLVINPLTIGTGLKIKMIEAMGLSRLVLSTPVGADGLETRAGKSFLLYRNTEELISRLNQIFSDRTRYMEICRAACELAEEWNLRNIQELTRIFS
jgi:glycosyltransferase involved in cell wall biosynthesis